MKTEDEDEDVIVIHLGKHVSDELRMQIANDIVKLMDRKYPINDNWRLES